MPSKDYRKLNDYLRSLGSCAIAFSGGLDSAFLLKTAVQVLGGRNVLALTVKAPYTPKRDIDDARSILRTLDVEHQNIEVPIIESIRNNPKERCYRCKAYLFGMIQRDAAMRGYDQVLEGTNASDLDDYRPGIRALRELGIRSPLLDCGITKEAIRRALKDAGDSLWNKPANACLLTRLPTGHRITEEELGRIGRAEEFLIAKGFTSVRVRSHGDLARIEIPRESRGGLLNEALMDAISKELKRYGYRFVTMELAGYSQGNMN